LLDVIFGGALLMNPPWSPRLVIAIPPVLICVVVGMVQMATYLQRALRRPEAMMWGVSLALVLVTGYGSLRFYFHDYTAGHVFREPNTEIANILGRYLQTLGLGYRCYFFGAPRMYFGHPPIPFFDQVVPGTDVVDPPDPELAFVDPDVNAVFVFLPERLSDLDIVRQRYPTGALREFRDDNGGLRFTAYEVMLRP
jgi:hypothetical protein